MIGWGNCSFVGGWIGATKFGGFVIGGYNVSKNGPQFKLDID
jgi:hypothetical protein